MMQLNSLVGIDLEIKTQDRESCWAGSSSSSWAVNLESEIKRNWKEA